LGSRAVFVDRDGVLNDLVVDREEGRFGSPLSAAQLSVPPFVAEAVREIRDELGFKVVVVSNQPGVAKKQFSLRELEKMNRKLREEAVGPGGSFDGEYYCLHHPDARVRKYRVACDCRKPSPGLLLRASSEMGLDLGSSYFVGDGLVDIKAGKSAGCRTVLVGRLTSFLASAMEDEGATPDYVVPSLKEVPALLRSRSQR
jgi:D-glycero-D-manno-heptose 1,7-bisphosphate phosphatase